MKLKSINTIEILNDEELVFVSGGRTMQRREHTRGHDTTNNDSLRHDGNQDPTIFQ